MGRKPINCTNLRPKSQRKKRLSFSRSELAELYMLRNFLPDGERPKGRTFAMIYSDLAKHFTCDVDLVSHACIEAVSLVKSGRICRCHDGVYRCLEEPLKDYEAAAYLGVSHITVRRWADKGILDALEGAPFRVDGQSVARVLTGKRQRPMRGRPPGRKGGVANGKAGS